VKYAIILVVIIKGSLKIEGAASSGKRSVRRRRRLKCRIHSVKSSIGWIRRSMQA